METEGLSILNAPADFNLWQTLDCGQCFRFSKKDDGVICGVALNRYIEFVEKDGKIYVNCDKDFCDNDLSDFFDFKRNYEKIKAVLSQDDTLKKAIEYAGGIRILCQPQWETLCSFIISQNNNIKRISGIIERLCENFGEKMSDGVYSFPTAERLSNLSEEDLAPIRCGFRAKYVIDAAKKVCSKEVDFEKIKSLSLNEARSELMKITGVGPKVADCTLLFGFHRLDAFPTDVWIKKALLYLYPDGFIKFADEYRGIAQQYLFHYVRTAGSVLPDNI